MATKTITALTAVSAGNLDDTAVMEVDDKNVQTRKATVAQFRTQLNTGPQAFAAGTAPGATQVQRITKAVAAIANAVATSVLTITIPNAAHSARVRVELEGSLGAGGAIGANEASGSVAYMISITRTAGVNAVGTISAAFGSAMANVAGGATITVTAALAAVVGAVGATNTIDVQVTITRGSGASTNHTCVVLAEVLNANATGVSIA